MELILLLRGTASAHLIIMQVALFTVGSPFEEDTSGGAEFCLGRGEGFIKCHLSGLKDPYNRGEKAWKHNTHIDLGTT